jgi:hypothetical protein
MCCGNEEIRLGNSALPKIQQPIRSTALCLQSHSLGFSEKLSRYLLDEEW